MMIPTAQYVRGDGLVVQTWYAGVRSGALGEVLASTLPQHCPPKRPWRRRAHLWELVALTVCRASDRTFSSHTFFSMVFGPLRVSFK